MISHPRQRNFTRKNSKNVRSGKKKFERNGRRSPGGPRQLQQLLTLVLFWNASPPPWRASPLTITIADLFLSPLTMSLRRLELKEKLCEQKSYLRRLRQVKPILLKRKRK
jgi:hypothetical protein